MVVAQKRKIRWVISLFLVMLYFSGMPAQAQYGGGSGTAGDPYLIYTAEQMNVIGANRNDWDKDFKLMADIDLSSFTGTDFNIIGNAWNNAFTGVFNGSGHTISNFSYISTDTNYIGLFGYVSGVIKDLGLIDANVDAGTGDYVGSLVGSLRYGTVNGCYVDGGSASGDDSVGGLVGGLDYGTITNCYATGSASGDDSVGGLVGNNYRGTITNCSSAGSVTGGTDVGGLVGNNYRGTITNCYSLGIVSGNGYVGGMVGDNTGEVMDSFWDIQTSGQARSAGGTGKTTAEMQDPNTFMDAGWDFVGEPDGPHDIWAEPVGGGYPILWWQLPPGLGLPGFSGGTGESDDPYLISTATELNSIGHNPRLMDAHFMLINDIDLTGIDFYIIGSEAFPFTGVFDGNGHTISNFSYTSTDTNYVGLFGYVEGADIKDLGLIAPDVDAEGGEYVGSLVGSFSNGTISNCYVEGGSVSGDRTIGGLVGYLNRGTITNCYATGSVSGDRTIGGLVGYLNRGTITNCSSEGSVSGRNYVGGLVGENKGGTITDCYSTGSVLGNNRVGGLVGNSWGGMIWGCYSTGPVSGVEYSTPPMHLGGLVGLNRETTISNCYAKGSVSGTENSSLLGGLVGSNNNSTIRNCYSVGRVSGNTRVGGLCGKHSVSGGIINCFWDKDTYSSPYSAGGWAMTTAEMMTESTYVGWNNGAWVIDEGKDYPHLVWENTPGEIIDYEYPRTYPGNGQDQPFELDSPDDLLCMSLRSADWDKNFVLTGDIDMSSVINYRPPALFTGTFNGQGHVLKNLEIDTSILGNYYHLGVFGIIGSGGKVSNLGVEDVKIIGGDFSRYLGGLCGESAGGTITGCYTTGSVSGGRYSDDLGGLCGDNDRGAIVQSYSRALVFSRGGSHDLGGLCGKNEGTITDCYATGTISGGPVYELGGLCGENDGGTITGCHATGSVSGDWNLGGLVGVGGNGGIISNCYATGSVSGNTYLGGLVGSNWDTTISNCYAKGSVSAGMGSWYLGGLVGYNEASTIRNCYSIGSVPEGTYVGGLCGKHSVSGGIVNSFWDKETSGHLYSAGGWAMTTGQMMSESTYVGWNNGAWVIDEGRDYPHLVWEGTAGDVIDYEYPRTYPGNGQDQPFELDSPDDVLCMSLRPADWDKNFILTGDVDMSSVIYYQPPVPFTGSFDGRGHVLRNLTVDASIIGSRYHLGLFGKIEADGLVANLGVEDVNIVGGDGCRYVGGLCGENAAGTIARCFTTGWVTGGTESDDLGGLCGDNERGTIMQSYSSASVSGGEGSHDLGGLCGKNEGTITDCYTTGTVSGGQVREVGGLCGENHRRGTLRNCYSIGAVSGGTQVGGLCGDNEGSAVRVRDCFWDTETSGQIRSDGGTSKSTAEMQTRSTFTDAGWDFVNEGVNGTEDIWCVCEGQNYPKLTWQFIPGDFNEDYNVDLFDLAILSGRWSLADSGFFWCRGADLTGDGFVDFNDLEVLAENWLAGVRSD